MFEVKKKTLEGRSPLSEFINEHNSSKMFWDPKGGEQEKAKKEKCSLAFSLVADQFLSSSFFFVFIILKKVKICGKWRNGKNSIGTHLFSFNNEP